MKTGETADKSDQNPEIAGGFHNPNRNRKGKGKGKGEHQDPNAGWKNPMQVHAATTKEKQADNTTNQLRASSKQYKYKLKELNEKLKKYEEKHGKLECKYSSDYSDSETDDDHFWKLQSPAEDTSLQKSANTSGGPYVSRT